MVRSLGRFIACVMACLAGSLHAANYSDIWWNPGESGWGLSIADHETSLFAVLYMYRQDGRPVWYTVPGGTFSADRRFFTGDVYHTRGTPYAQAFDASRVLSRRVGTATFDFAPPGLAAGSALLSYTIDGVTRSKPIERTAFGSAAAGWGRDFTDLWFNPAESGWGLALAQHGGDVFGVWYTHDADGEPLWLVMPGVSFTAASSFHGKLFATTGPWFGAASFDPGAVNLVEVGESHVSVVLSAAGLCQGATAIWDAHVNRAPFGAVNARRSACPLPFGMPSGLAGAQPAGGAAGKGCLGSYSASVAVPPACGMAGMRAFGGALALHGIDWNAAGRQQGTARLGNFLVALSAGEPMYGGYGGGNTCEPMYVNFEGAVLDLTLSAAGAGALTASGTIDVGAWKAAVELSIPAAGTVTGRFSYSYHAEEHYMGEGTFSCQVPG